MPQTKIHQTNSERQKAYRLRLKSEGRGDNRIHRIEEWRERNPAKYKAQRKRKQKVFLQHKKETRMFIAIDGEGITDHKDLYEYKSNGKTKFAPKHYYTLLSASNHNGDIRYFVEDYKSGLSTKRCFEFLLDIAADNPGAIFCIFAGNYDANMMLCYDFDKDTAKTLWETGECKWQGYHVMWLPSKSFSIQDISVKGGQSIIIYDVFGFFQSSFIKALEGFGFEVPKEIKEGKEERTLFTAKDKIKTRAYNFKECELLCQMMNKLRESMIECNFLPDRWHGAGAIASVMFKRAGIAEHNYMPQKFWKEIVSAYYGGRNQMLKQGELGDVWIHDINSAYPHAMHTLPTSLGVWEEIKPQKEIYEYGLHFVEWDLVKMSNNKITPFPFRNKGRIFWTIKGSGWYWSPEVVSAICHYGKAISIKRTIQFYPDSDCRPFDFLSELYQERLKLIKQGSEAQLPLKLGLNSVYGKVAQSIGYKNQRPLYQNHFWAGYLTSRTRARMFEMAMTKPESVVFFATDGLVSTERLVEGEREKVFGAWEVKQLKNFFGLQSGVYTYECENESRYKSRGFHHRSVSYEQVREIWQKNGVYGCFEYKETRFTGLGIALKTDFGTWGRWIEHERKLNFVPVGEYDERKRRRWTAIDIFPPSLEAIESESYKLKQNWFEDDEYISLLDQPNLR